MSTPRKPARYLLYGLAILCVVASLAYWVSGIADTWEWTIHADRHVRDPFRYDSDTLRVDSVQREAASAGLQAGDKLVALDGAPYRGKMQWQQVTSGTRPGDHLRVEFLDSKGHTGTANLVFAPHENAWRTVSASGNFWRALLSFHLIAGICVFVGGWVVLARPRERNAWLVFLLLLFPNVLYFDPQFRGGWEFVLQMTWYQLLQFFCALNLLLFGIYFPERSRIDARAPWIKNLIVAMYVAAFLIWLPALIREFAADGNPPWVTAASDGVGHAVDFLNLMCVLSCLVLLLDKLRSASTEDARRRLRVLSAGMSVGMGALLIIYVLLPDLGVNLRTGGMWLMYLGSALFAFAPLSLAYVVVVQRAMDVRVLVRMGTRYLLAKALLWGMQGALLVWAAMVLLVPETMARKSPDASLLGPAIFVALILLLRFIARAPVQTWLDRKFFREAYNSEQMLNDLSEEVRRFTETQPLLETVAQRISETLHVTNIGLLLRSGDGFELQQAIGLPINGGVSLAGRSSAVRHLMNSNEPARLYKSRPDAWYLMAGEGEREALKSLRAEVLLPLPGRNRLIGLMALGPKRSEAAYSHMDLQLLQTVASQTGMALEVSELAHSLAAQAARHERVNREIEIAREVQERFFPQQMPVLPNATIAGQCRPALGVGGDYYDVMELDGGRIGLAIGDVSGKGISAALLMASLRASLRGLTLDGPGELARLMSKMNRLVYEASASNRYATFFFVAYDPASGELACVNAGHNPPLLLRGSEVVRIEASGPVVGLLPEAAYEEHTVRLEPGDTLLLYTDGISEAMTARDEEWGEERMIEAARASKGKSAEEILRAIFAAADRFTAGAPQHDDMTLLVLQSSLS